MTCFFLFHPDLAVEKKHVLTRVNAPLISYNEPVMKAKMVIRGQINGHPKRSMVKNCRIFFTAKLWKSRRCAVKSGQKH